MMIRYLYLDDADLHQLEPFTEPIEEARKSLTIELRKPKRFDEQVEELKTLSEQFDGLILDLLLHQMPNEQGERANYRGTTLAQHLRTLGTEESAREVPIVLWSDASKLEVAYNSDATAHDLFDITCSKEKLVEEASSVEMGLQLEALAEGYKTIREIRAHNELLYEFLGLTSASGLDPRIDEFFVGKHVPVHEYARLIIKALLLRPGILIDERVLAARLGIDYRASKDWEKLKHLLKNNSYLGVFNKGWPRWWAHQIEAWWRSFSDTPLRSMPATKRVEAIKEMTKLKRLKPAPPIAERYSTAYWTVCQATLKPLDPRDGLIITNSHEQPWQEKLYVSLEAELNQERRLKGFRLDPLEKERIPKLRVRLEVTEAPSI